MSLPSLGAGSLSVVIADDDADVREMFKTVLLDDGRFGLAGTVDSGRALLDLLDQVEPDAIVLDQQMPDVTGLDVLPEVRSRSDRACIVLWTSSSVDVHEARQRGATLCLDKTVIAQHVLDQVYDVCSSEAGSRPT